MRVLHKVKSLERQRPNLTQKQLITIAFLQNYYPSDTVTVFIYESRYGGRASKAIRKTGSWYNQSYTSSMRNRVSEFDVDWSKVLFEYR